MNWRGALRRFRAEACEWSGANARARQRLDGSCAAILFYHRVMPRADARRDSVEPGMYVTPQSFARQLDCLREHFHVLPLHEIAARIEARKALPPGACAITFDDGWRDNLQHALPQLVERDMSATLFVVTERVDTPGAFWPDEVSRRWTAADAEQRRRVGDALGLSAPASFEAALEQLKSVSEAERGELLDRIRATTPDPDDDQRELLDWTELAQMADAGIAIESHGATHAILTGLPEVEVERELRDSRDRLRERGHGRHDLLAYPSGGWDRRVADIARAQGYRAAFSTERALATTDCDPLAVPRLGVHEDISSSRAEFLYRVPGTA